MTEDTQHPHDNSNAAVRDANTGRWTIAAGATLAATGVLAGAFGAHALKRMLEPAKLAVWDTAAEYQLVHAVALILVGMLVLYQPASRWLSISAAGLLAGLTLFSGSLYVYVLSGIRVFAMVTPVGGILLVIGWSALIVWALQRR